MARAATTAPPRGQTPVSGIATDGQPVPGLFPIRATGVSTAPIQPAAEARA